MTEKQNPATKHNEAENIPAASAGAVSTAPEVPHAIAKQYGLHKEPLHASSKTADTSAAQAAPAGQQPVTDSAQPDEDTISALDARIESPETDAAVEDILSKESDQLLGIQTGEALPPPVQKPAGRFKRFFRSWWRNKWARYSTIIIILLAIAAAAAIPDSRYAILNRCGVRSSASVIALDDTTQLPLKNVTISIDEQTAQTNRDGVAAVHNLKLGKHRLTVKRLAFAPYSQDITIGWGSNPLGKVSLKAVGSQYEILVKDFLSGKPIAGAEAESESVNALSDKNGKIVLTVSDTNITSLDIALNAPGYRTEKITLNGTVTQHTELAMVPSQKTVFVSKESGKYDVYSSDLDGRDKKLLLAGSGLEGNTISLAVSPDNSQAALVSTRDNLRDEDGYLLYALTFINVATGASVTVDHAQQLQLVDWLGTKLIYRSTSASASAANPARNRLVAYNYQANARTQLAAANQFNTVLSANGYVYYSVSSNDPNASLGLYRVKPDTSDRERLTDQEVWTGLRTGLNTISLQTPAGWFSFDLSSKKVQSSGAPANFTSFYFAADPKDTQKAWADTRDGKGVLLLKQNDSDQTKTLVVQPGLAAPLRWLNDQTLIYRVVTSSESADYAVSTEGGPPRKISNVSATYSYVQAY